MLSSFLLSLATATSVPSVRVEVDGAGFFAFAHEGRLAYSASATLVVTDGLLGTSNGAILMPQIRVPESLRQIEVEEDGDVYVTLPTYRARAGRITLSLLPRFAERRPFGSFFVSPESPSMAAPGTLGAGYVRPGGMGSSAMRSAPASKSVEPPPFEPVRIIPVELRPEARLVFDSSFEAVSERITLGEIARVEGDPEAVEALSAIPIADTPLAGKARNLDRKRILEELKKANVDTSKIELDMPRRVVVRRKSQDVSNEQLADVAVEAVREQLGEDSEFTTKVVPAPSLAPPGEIELDAENVALTDSGASVIVVVYVNGERYQSRVVKVKTAGSKSSR